MSISANGAAGGSGVLWAVTRAADENDKVIHSELVPEIKNEPNYDAALAALDQGAQILRVHDVAETRQAAEVWRGIRLA